MNEQHGHTVAMFGAGCFWGVEAAFMPVKGVVKTEVGYAGGYTENPTYEDVCSGATGHAEVVRVGFDPKVILYEQLLEVFWGCHDPTQRNRQGPDVGAQYRSVIFYFDEEQKVVAERSKEELQAAGRYGSRQVVTEILAAGPFYRAEEYHQKYFQKKGGASCHI